MKRKLEEYIDCGFYEGDEDIANYQQKVVKCRKDHLCSSCQQKIGKGKHSLRETGFMDGAPVQNYVCIPCLDKWLDEIEPIEDGNDDDEECVVAQGGISIDK